MKYLRILWRIARMSTMIALMYRMNIIVGWIVDIAWMAGSVGMIYFYFSLVKVQTIAGFSIQDFYFVLLCNQVVWRLADIFVWSNGEIFFYQVHNGELDSFILRPLSPVFGIIFQRLWLDDVFKLLFYIGVLVVYGSMMGTVITIWQLALIIFIILVSFIVMFSFIWISHLLCFFWERFNVLWKLFHGMDDAGRMPKQIFPGWLRLALTYLVPTLLVVNPVYDVLAGTFSWYLFIKIILVTAMFGMIFAVLWQAGLRRYNSAA